MGRNGHDGARAVAGEHVVADPDRNFLSAEGIDSIRAGEDTGHLLVDLAFAFGLMLHLVEIGLHDFLTLGSGEHPHVFRFGSEHHEGDSEYGVGARSEYLELDIRILYGEAHLSSFAPAYPVALCLLEGVAPCQGVEVVEQAGSVGRYAKAPLAHELLLYGETSAHAQSFRHLVVGEYGAEFRTPVHHRLSLEGDAPVHQRVAFLLFRHGVPLVGRQSDLLCLGRMKAFGAVLFEMRYEFGDRAGLSEFGVVVMVEHLHERPLRPFVVFWIACAHFAAPIERESYLVELGAIARDVVDCGLLRVLSGLDGILLCGEAVGVVAHRVEHIESFLAFVA